MFLLLLVIYAQKRIYFLQLFKILYISSIRIKKFRILKPVALKIDQTISLVRRFAVGVFVPSISLSHSNNKR